jgi:DNA-binding response OmpR family regulator
VLRQRCRRALRVIAPDPFIALGHNQNATRNHAESKGMSEDARLLIVEDNLPFARGIARWLTAEGYDTALAPGIAEFRRLYRNQGADLVLLDLNLGADDGFTLAAELGGMGHVGLIIMTGRDEIEDRVRGLDAGADDYLVKPFAMEELGARVRAVLRRRPRFQGGERLVRLGPVQLDIGLSEVRCDGVRDVVRLTERQGAILHRLIIGVGTPVERAELLPHHRWEPGDRSVDVHIGHVRRKLAAAGIDMLAISTVRGLGYRLDLVSDADTAGDPAVANAS